MEADPLRSPTRPGQRVIFLDPHHPEFCHQGVTTEEPARGWWGARWDSLPGSLDTGRYYSGRFLERVE